MRTYQGLPELQHVGSIYFPSISTYASPPYSGPLTPLIFLITFTTICKVCVCVWGGGGCLFLHPQNTRSRQSGVFLSYRPVSQGLEETVSSQQVSVYSMRPGHGVL